MKQFSKMKFWLLGLVFVLLLSLCSVCMITEHTETASAAATAEQAISDLNFSLKNNSTEYKVSAANKQLTVADIPAEYNGLPVTEVADNAFISCANLQAVSIPASVTRVGNNAFFSCKSLTRVVGMPNVTNIGNNAFGMCTNLDKLILPSRIQTLGSGIIRNVPNEVYSRASEEQMQTLNSNWNTNSTATIYYGNDLACDPITSNGELIGYSVNPSQNLYSDDDIILNCSYAENGKTYPILNISRYAFEACIAKSFTIRYDENLDSDFDVNICSDAFFYCFAEEINIEVNITLQDSATYDSDYPQYENGTSIEVFLGSMARSITLPDSLTMITRSMFSNCANLQEIRNTNGDIAVNHLSSKITTICTQAFDSCTALSELYIPDSVERMSDNLFNNWGSQGKQTVYFGSPYPADGWDENWNSGIKEENANNVDFIFRTIRVHLDQQGGTDGSGSVEAIYGNAMPSAVAPVRKGYRFNGYFTEENGKGTQYYTEKMGSARVWDIKSETILYADWKPTEFVVAIDNGGGEGITQITVSYGNSMPAIDPPTRTGYTFKGYYLGANGTSKQYYDGNMQSVRVWEEDENTKLYANWEANRYQVTFDNQGGNGVSDSIEVTFGNAMPSGLPVPTRNGYSFMGYYVKNADGSDTYYYNANMGSEQAWNREFDTTLTAKWDLITYTITYYNALATEIPSSNPTSYTVESPDIVLENPTGRVGYYGYWNPASIPHGSYGNLSVTAYWTPFEYEITYQVGDWKNNARPGLKSYDIETSLVFEPLSAVGYTFSWSPKEIKPGTTGPLTVVGTWTANTYQIDVDNTLFRINENTVQSAMNLPTSYQYGTELDLSQFKPYFLSAQYLSLEGFYNREGHEVTKITDKTTGLVELVAKWRINLNKIGVNEFTVTDKGYDSNKKVGCGISTLNLDNLREIGINQVVYQIKFDYKLIDDGYQYARLYSPSTKETLWEVEISGEMKDKYTEYYSGFILIDFDTLGSAKDLQLQFDASGAFADDWSVKNLKVSVQLIGKNNTLVDMLA